MVTLKLINFDFCNSMKKFLFFCLIALLFFGCVPSPDLNREAVDMGLSVKWDSRNMGAIIPEASGDFYAWGELQPKSCYDWETYRWYDDESGITKYVVPSENSSFGPTDNKTVLEPEDDVAKKLKGKWRMPTVSEWEELLNPENCTWVWEESNGVDGYRVTSLKSNNSIFLPAVGCIFQEDPLPLETVRYGAYWSTGLYTRYCDCGLAVMFDSGRKQLTHHGRPYGCSIRPVCEY